jgi:hypothetical protein
LNDTRPALWQAIPLAAVAILNLLLDGVLIWLMEHYSSASNWLNEALIGTLLGCIALTGLWCGLGDGRWYLRVAVGVALCIATAWFFACIAMLTARSPSSSQPDEAMALGFLLMPILLAVALFAFQLRRLRGWRLTWFANTASQPGKQYQLGDMLLWMVLIGGALAAIRFLNVLDSSFYEGLLDLGLLAAHVALVTFITTVITFRRAGLRLRDLAFLALAIILLGSLFSSHQIYVSLRISQPGLGVIAYASLIFRHLGDHLAISWSAAITTFVSCVVLKRTGCTLVRPASRPLATSRP